MSLRQNKYLFISFFSYFKINNLSWLPMGYFLHVTKFFFIQTLPKHNNIFLFKSVQSFFTFIITILLILEMPTFVSIDVCMIITLSSKNYGAAMDDIWHKDRLQSILSSIFYLNLLFPWDDTSTRRSH